MSSTRIYGAWSSLKQCGQLPTEWQDWDAFRQAVGDPPCKNACLARYDHTKPHSAQNTFWMYPALLQNDPAFLKRLRKKSNEERVAHDKMLLQISNARDRKQRNRCMIAARKAGYTLRLIGMAANVTPERVRVITTRCR
jgi:hypothetical protein